MSSYLLLFILAACAPQADIQADARVEAYLARSVASWMVEPRCAYDVVDRQPHALYVWTMCRSASGQQGVSLPVVIKTDGSGMPLSHAAPREGSFYAGDLETLFPPQARAQLRGARHQRRLGYLQAKLSSGTSDGVP